MHGYTREILERDGEPAAEVYAALREYAGGLPLVSYNVAYDLEDVLKPEWRRLGVDAIGTAGLCALRLAQRLLDPVPAGNCKEVRMKLTRHTSADMNKGYTHRELAPLRAAVAVIPRLQRKGKAVA